jgi:hypothetical protein
MSIQKILEIVRSPRNGMRHKNPIIIDIDKSDLSWLHITGGAMNSVMAWLQKHHKNQIRELKRPEIGQHNKDIFAILGEPSHRYWTGIIEWSSNFGVHEWWQHDDLMEWFPHFDRYTLRYSEYIEQVPPIKHFFKVGPLLSENMASLIKRYNLDLKFDFPHVKPRYKWAPAITKIYDEILPKFKKIVKQSPELSKKLEEYLEPDYVYYQKAI